MIQYWFWILLAQLAIITWSTWLNYMFKRCALILYQFILILQEYIISIRTILFWWTSFPQDLRIFLYLHLKLLIISFNYLLCFFSRFNGVRESTQPHLSFTFWGCVELKYSINCMDVENIDKWLFAVGFHVVRIHFFR